jgi:MinD-like ATPase involved in chromosome partitioning or flagellar assembly/tetratricopeptide (TPR) repeat protein
MAAVARRPGRIVTFYSYKGGTGRSMALANIAWILACNGKRVLTIDWDLEAPGLHRYFRPFLLDAELSASEGLIDLIDRYATAAIAPITAGMNPSPDWYLEYADFSDHVLGLDFDHFPPGGKIDLLPAGRQSDTYAVKVSSFNWQNFYDRLGGGAFLEAVKERARAEYDYILIDSRTGVSDTAGICTAQLPDSLVVCFTYNNQSIKGAAAVARSALATQARLAEERRAREGSARGSGAGNASGVDDTPLPYVVYPVPMRVDAGESERLALRQAYARESFAELVTHIAPSEIAEYWSGVEVPHRVFYAYEEVLAPFKDDAHDPKTVLAAFLRLTCYITNREVTDYLLPIAPEVRQGFLEAFAETPLTAQAKRARAEAQRESIEEALVRNADAALYSLGDEEKQAAQQVLCRLVRLGRDEEGGGSFPIRATMSDFDFAQRSAIGELARRGVLNVTSDLRSQTTLPPPIPGVTLPPTPQGEQSVSFANGALVVLWPTLLRWLDADREFLIWRQQLRTYLADWDRSGRDRGAFLSGTLLAEAQLWLHKRAADLNAVERGYIEASGANARRLEATPPAAAAALPQAQVRAARPSAPLPLPAPAAPPRRARSWTTLLLATIGIVALISAAGWLLASRGPAGVATVTTTTPASGAPVAVDPAVERRQRADAEIAAGDALVAGDDAAKAGAAAAYARALAIDPSHLEAALKLGRCRESLGDFDGADTAYAQAMQIAPTSAAPWLERAASRAGQGRYGDAVADYTRAIALQGDDAAAYFNRGAANERQNKTAAARADYSAALGLNPEFIDALLARAKLLAPSQPAAAIADYQSVLTLPASARDQQIARDGLKLLANKTVTKGSPRIAIRFRDTADVVRVNELRAGLASSMRGASVAAPELRPDGAGGEVRYYVAGDEPLARQVMSTTELLLARQGIRTELKLRLLDANESGKAPPGTVEVRLPSLSATQPVARPAFVSRGIAPQTQQVAPRANDPPPQIYRK